MSFLHRINGIMDKSCSATVSATVVGVNLYCLPRNLSMSNENTTLSIAVLFATSACCVTAACSKVIKRVVNQSRPAGRRGVKLSPGMPSNHATALAFLAITGCVGLAKGGALSSSSSSSLLPSPLLAAQFSLVAYSLYATRLRVACGHHTWPQVAVGYGFGSAAAAAFLYTNYYGYTDGRAGGRVDDLPACIKVMLAAACTLTCLLAFRSILKGSSALNRKNLHGEN